MKTGTGGPVLNICTEQIEHSEAWCSGVPLVTVLADPGTQLEFAIEALALIALFGKILPDNGEPPCRDAFENCG